MKAATAAPNWAMPDARVVLPATAPREQWLTERRKGIGSSDIATLLGVNRYGSEYEVWLDKTGRGVEREATPAMQRGTWLEPHLSDHFTDRTGLAVRRCGLIQSRDLPILQATPDRIVEDGSCVEIKTFNSRARVADEWAEGGIARHAYVQGQHQLAVSGRSHLWFVAYEIDREPQIRGPVARDEQVIARIRERAQQWWTDHILADVAPPVDLATITDEEIALRWPTAEPGTTVQARWPASLRALLAERAEVKAQESEAKARAKEIDQALRVMAGDAEALLIGERPVATFKTQHNNPSVDPALAADHPEIYDRYIKRSSSRRIHIFRNWDQS